MSTSLAIAAHGAPQPRAPEFVMRPERLGAMQPSRLSLSRALVLKALHEHWRVETRRFDIDAEARGTAVYEIVTPGRSFTFCAFSVPPQRTGRTGRIIGRAWDMQGALIEGAPDEATIEATRTELPKLYQGLRDTILAMPDRRVETERRLASTRRRLDELREELGKPFEHEERLTALLGRQRALAAELDLDKDEAGTQGLEATEESLAA